MIRIIVREVNSAGCEVGAPTSVTYKTLDFDAPAVEAHLQDDRRWISREVVGVEVLAPSKPATPGGGT